MVVHVILLPRCIVNIQTILSNSIKKIEYVRYFFLYLLTNPNRALNFIKHKVIVKLKLLTDDYKSIIELFDLIFTST